MEDMKPIFTAANEATMTTTKENTSSERQSSFANVEQQGMFSAFNTQRGNDCWRNPEFSWMAQENFRNQEPQVADTAPPTADVDGIMNFPINGSETLFEEMDHNLHNLLGGSQTESSNIWGEGSTVNGSGARNGDMIDTFDFLVKSLSSASNYVSMLTREQLFVLRSIRPGLLYEFLTEVAKVLGDKRMRRALPNECAFCKNNGENEECYASHALKDWRGRVLCPVLRAFRCPRCNATGDRAHTIKYCPENEAGLERSGSYGSRRRWGSGQATPSPTVTSPTPAAAASSISHSTLWNTFGIN